MSNPYTAAAMKHADAFADDQTKTVVYAILAVATELGALREEVRAASEQITESVRHLR